MSSPSVSIIVPVYNVISYLDDCITNLILQTMENIEILCIDDGSTDGSAHALDTFAEADKRITVIHKENGGVAAARNTGLEIAQGEYVMFVDADDYIARSTCEKTYDVAHKNDADIVVFGGKTFPTFDWGDWTFSNRDKIYKDDGVNALLYERGANPLMCNKLYRNSFLKTQKAVFDETLTIGEDNAFQFTVFPAAKTVVFLKEQFYFYRIRENSAVTTSLHDYDKRLTKHFDVVRSVWDAWGSRGFLSGKERDLFEWTLTYLYFEAIHASFDTRQEISKELLDFFTTTLGTSRSASLIRSDRFLQRYRFFEDAAEATSIEPIVTIIVDSPDDLPLNEIGLRSLLEQSIQNIEILFTANPKADKQKQIESYAQHDKRIRFIQQDDSEALLSSARGSFILCTTSYVQYERIALRKMLECAGVLHPLAVSDNGDHPEFEADLVVALDSMGILALKDAFIAYKPDPTIDFYQKQTYSSNEFGSFVASSLSAFPDNKLISKALFAATLKYLPPKSACFTTVNACIQNTNRCITAKQPCLTFLPFEYASDYTSLITSRINETLRALEAFLSSQHPMDMDARLADIKDSLNEYLNICTYMTPSTAYEDQTLNRVTNDGVCRLDQITNFAEEIRYLQQRIEQFEESISFRIGRTVTALPRAVVTNAKKLLAK